MATKRKSPEKGTVQEQAKAIGKAAGDASLPARRGTPDAVKVEGDSITINLVELATLSPNARDARLLSLGKTLTRFAQSPDRILSQLDPQGKYDREPVPQRNREARANQGELVSGKLSDDPPVLS